jgi:small subunit ribosomal protein S7
MINCVMRRGKKTVAEGVVYRALDQIKAMLNEDPLEVLVRAVDNVKPRVEVRSRRVGGSTYQVPVEVNKSRQLALALRWITQFSIARKGVPLGKAMAQELVDAYKNQGNAIRKRDDVHKMAQANKAFAHYAW